MAPPGTSRVEGRPRLDEAAMADLEIRSVFQPIVHLDSGEVVAYEALARGPVGTPWEMPADLFGAAAAAGRTGQLDRLCQVAAFDHARAAGLGRDAALFVNVEPEVFTSTPSPEHAAQMARASAEFRLVLEITERAITAHPGGLLGAIASARRDGASIAIDDLGVDDAALALLPFIAPDVIKLDLRLIQDRPGLDIARWVSAALAEQERNGATILAEGIETAAHLEQARALGATLGQGYLFARPGAIAPNAPYGSWHAPERGQERPAGRTPYAVVAAERPTRVSTKAMLTAMSQHIEARAEGLSSPGVLVSAFQDREHFTSATTRRYEGLASSCALVAVLGAGLDALAIDGIRCVGLEQDDPLRDEWSVLVVGPHEAAALVARDLGDRGPEATRRFDYAITHDRDLVIEAARTILDRL